MAVIATAGQAMASLYTEDFANSSTTTAQRLSTVGWSVNSGNTGTDVTATTSTSASGQGIIWHTNGRDSQIGYGFGANISAGAIWWTQEFSPIPQSAVQSISFYSNNTNTTADTYRIVVRLDNNTPADTSDDFWVATATTYYRDVGTATGGSGNWGSNSELESFSYSTAAAQWHDLTFNPGVSLAVAPLARTAELPSGNITAAGLYGIGGGSFRFDNFAIIPEPTSAIALGACVVGLLSARRRRRQAGMQNGAPL